jgi:hypothetical protein
MKPKTLRLPSLPMVGMVVMHQGQRFELCAVQPHVTHRGLSSLILQWQSHCATCAQAFTVSTGRAVSTLNRRCSSHHAPGRRVVEQSLVTPPEAGRRVRTAREGTV